MASVGDSSDGLYTIRVFEENENDNGRRHADGVVPERNARGRGRGRGRRGVNHGNPRNRGNRGGRQSDEPRRYESGRGNVSRMAEAGGRVNTSHRGGRSVDHDAKPSRDSDGNYVKPNDDYARGGDKKRSERIGNETQPMQFHKLVYLSKQIDDPDKVLLDISNTRSGFKEFLENPIEAKCYVLLFKVLRAVVSSRQLFGVREVLQLLEQHFLTKLPEVLQDICARTPETRYIWNNNNELAKFISMVTTVLKKSMIALHSSLSKCSVVLLSLKQIEMTFFQKCDGVVANEIEEATNIQKAVREEQEKLREEKVRRMVKPKRKRVDLENMEPPEDFRTLSILPTLMDLQMDEKPFLRANKARGTYDSLDTYLDIQYRLLREDFINPLRSGITQYRDSVKNNSNMTKLRDIRLYHDVQILRPVCSASGINYVIQFDVSRFSKMNWASSKRLMHGSLLCLTNDDFDSAFYAIVSERKDKDLNEGMLQVHFEGLPEWLETSNKFIMAETTAYFEAYRHILQGLQETLALPLQRYIINCETIVKPPEYLLRQGGPSYDFGCLMEIKDDVAEFPVLNTCHWPDKSALNFDSSQYEALKTAITKELAIIQGPPGTGKTYVGLKIARLLKENKVVWQKNKDRHSILVVCYTNHALDQFLEGILDFSEGGIVRIGGRCGSELLEEFMLKNLKKKKREERNRSWGILQNEKDCRRQLRESEQFIASVSSKLQKTATEIIPFKTLSQFMTVAQVHTFVKFKAGDDNKVFMNDWLGFTVQETDEEETGNMKEENKIKRLWESYIVDQAERISENMSNIYIWDLDMHTRARLYKSWVFEFIGTVELKLIEIRSGGSETSFKAAEEILEKLIMFTETQIVGAKTISNYIKSPLYQSQLQQLTSALGADISGGNVMCTWLCLDGSKHSTEIIKATLESIQKEDESNIDLEEERELRDDDLLFTYDENGDTDESKKAMEDEEDWTVQWKKKKTRKEVAAMLRKSTAIHEREADALFDLWNLPLSKKRNLYRYWLDKYREDLRGKVKGHEKQYNEITLRLEEVRNQETLEILKSADFIGMTTTGAAKYRSLLQSVGPRIIIVEEAAEVLESHVVTTLNDECKHLILIGDHKQLRPSTTVYELAKKYSLDISLFERLVNNGVPCVTLSEQHRMRPSISVLMRHKNLYPHLRDHPVVYKYDNVKGLDVNMQFITHEEMESTGNESTSYYNSFEAKFLSKFCSHLLKQGYLPEQITVLSPYMGQVFTLRKEMPKSEFEGVRITAVDNYQGEENDIILLSLVRSSKPGKSEKRNPIGFLGIENRVCVALSRAKVGLFVFGNFSLLRNYSEMWEYMAQHVTKIGSNIKLICENHPKNIVFAKGPDDFKEMPEGGCKEPCGYSLKCGHICERFCHIVDKEHKYTKCFKPCPKKCEFGHRCKKKCHEECKTCDTIVEKPVPMCGHVTSMPCHKDPHTWKCETKCTFTLNCGHECKQSCHLCKKDIHRSECKEKCERTLSCGHTVNIECFRGTEVECSVLCATVLDCGHKCAGKCGVCHGGKIHSGCKGSCSKILPCGHKCSFPCSELCPPCTRKCEFMCPHSIKCKNKCSEPCANCIEECKFKCKHKTCDKLCNESCEDMICENPCLKGIKTKDKKSDCSHKCIGLCGEICPKLCAVCNKGELEDGDYTYVENDRFIELPDCGHVIEVKRMDSIMSKPIEHRGEMVKRCPKCTKVIRKSIRRYANTLRDTRQAVVDRFKRLTGSISERSNKAEQLKMEINNLRLVGIGLDDEEINALHKQVNSDKFGMILVSGRKIKYFSNVLRIRKEFASFVRLSNIHSHLQFCMDGIRDAKIVQKILLVEKQYVAKQYWREIELEIRRLEYILDLMKLREDKYKNGFGDTIMENYFEKAMVILTDGRQFDKSRADILEQVTKRLSCPPKYTHDKTTKVSPFKYGFEPNSAKSTTSERYKPAENKCLIETTSAQRNEDKSNTLLLLNSRKEKDQSSGMTKANPIENTHQEARDIFERSGVIKMVQPVKGVDEISSARRSNEQISQDKYCTEVPKSVQHFKNLLDGSMENTHTQPTERSLQTTMQIEESSICSPEHQRSYRYQPIKSNLADIETRLEYKSTQEYDDNKNMGFTERMKASTKARSADNIRSGIVRTIGDVKNDRNTDKEVDCENKRTDAIQQKNTSSIEQMMATEIDKMTKVRTAICLEKPNVLKSKDIVPEQPPSHNSVDKDSWAARRGISTAPYRIERSPEPNSAKSTTSERYKPAENKCLTEMTSAQRNEDKLNTLLLLNSRIEKDQSSGMTKANPIENTHQEARHILERYREFKIVQLVKGVDEISSARRSNEQISQDKYRTAVPKSVQHVKNLLDGSMENTHTQPTERLLQTTMQIEEPSISYSPEHQRSYRYQPIKSSLADIETRLEYRSTQEYEEKKSMGFTERVMASTKARTADNTGSGIDRTIGGIKYDRNAYKEVEFDNKRTDVIQPKKPSTIEQMKATAINKMTKVRTAIHLEKPNVLKSKDIVPERSSAHNSVDQDSWAARRGISTAPYRIESSLANASALEVDMLSHALEREKYIPRPIPKPRLSLVTDSVTGNAQTEHRVTDVKPVDKTERVEHPTNKLIETVKPRRVTAPFFRGEVHAVNNEALPMYNSTVPTHLSYATEVRTNTVSRPVVRQRLPVDVEPVISTVDKDSTSIRNKNENPRERYNPFIDPNVTRKSKANLTHSVDAFSELSVSTHKDTEKTTPTDDSHFKDIYKKYMKRLFEKDKNASDD